MERIRPLVITVALALGGCSSFPFEYAKLTGDNVTTVKTGRGPFGYQPTGEGRIPYHYVVKESGATLTLTMSQWLGPNFELVSSVPIRSISIDGGYVSPRSQFQYKLSWGLADLGRSRAGQVVEIKVELEDRPDPILISGVIAESGEIRQLCLWACPPRRSPADDRPQAGAAP